MYTIESRRRRLVNTDPLRHCYNGANYSSETEWSEWDSIDFNISPENVQSRLAYWRSLNDYAISERGKGSRREYRAIDENGNVTTLNQ